MPSELRHFPAQQFANDINIEVLACPIPSGQDARARASDLPRALQFAARYFVNIRLARRWERRMELYQVRYFVALAKLLNFTRAAEHCNVTQPALTKAVQKLEVELGGELIYRERHLTQLTELGKIVLPMLQRILVAACDVRASAAGFQRKEVAPLKIGLPSCVSPVLLAEILPQLSASVPGLQVELIDTSMAQVTGMLLSGDLSAALVGDLNDELPDRIDQWSLFDERVVLLVPPTSQFADLDCVPVGALQEVTWLERIGCDTSRRFWKRYFPEENPRIAHRGHQEAHLHQMVAAGLGVLLAGEHVPTPASVLVRPIENSPVRRDIRLLAVAGRRYSPALEAFLRLARVHDWDGFSARSETEVVEPSPMQPRLKCVNGNGRATTSVQ